MLQKCFVKNQLVKFLVLREFPVWLWRTGKRPELLLQVVWNVWCFGATQLCRFSFLCGFDYKSCVGLTKVSACFGSVL